MSERADRRADVLRVIALDGPIPRAHIAEVLGVSPATVTAITRDLLEAGLVTMAGKAPAQGRRGRPLEMLQVAPEAATVIGAKVTTDFVAGVLVDLRGEVIDRFTVAYDPQAADPAAALAQVLEGASGAARGRLVGIGLGVPGTVATDPDGHVTSPMLGWEDLPLGRAVADHLGVPVLVDNDVNTLATGERLYGAGRDVEDFLTVTIGRGVGLGIVLDGTLRRGRGGAGELGHTHAVAGGPRCDCGRTGCLETVAAEPALVAQAHAAGLLPTDQGIAELRTLATDVPDAAVLFAAAGAHLGTAVADLVNVLAPQRVVMAGEGTVAWPLFEAGFTPALRAGLLGFHRDVEVVMEPWEDGMWARGAAAQVLGSLFSPTTAQAHVTALHSRLHDEGPDGEAMPA